MTVQPPAALQRPAHDSYDVVIVGGAIMGASAAWWLSDDSGFRGRVLVVERDPQYRFASTTHTNSCIRQQFSTALNVRISQFGAAFFHDLRARMGGDARVPVMRIHNFGYLYLAGTQAGAEALRAAHAVQVAEGAGTRLLTPDQIAAEWPFYDLDGIVLGSHNSRDEGFFDGSTLFDWFRRSGRERGVEYIGNEVVAIGRQGARIESVTLKSGEVVACGAVVNASGPRAALTARMIGTEIPVEPRKRHTWIFTAERPLDRTLPLTIDPSGVHVRQDSPRTYMAGGHADHDPAVAYDDFGMDHDLWPDKIWPALATRIPQFEAIRVQSEWVGHYAYNTFDQNAICGPHPEVDNFLFLNGFSGHGLQQSPAMGRGTAEWLVQGAYRTLDLTPFHFDRIARKAPVIERAII